MLKILSIIPRIQLIFLFCLVLSGCQTTPSHTAGVQGQNQLIRSAELLLAKASKVGSPEKELYQLQAAQQLNRAEAFSRTATVLDGINKNNLSDNSFLTYVVLYIGVAKHQDDYFLVRTLTAMPRLASLWDMVSQETRAVILTERADVQALLGEEQQAIATYHQLSALMVNTEDKISVHSRIWFIANQLPFDTLITLADNEPDEELAGWYQLALAYRQQGGNIRQQMALFNQWRKMAPNHGAALYPPAGLSALNAAVNGPRHVALLLPTSGKLAQAGQAIQSGFLAAWYEGQQQFGDSPKVSFYDTGGSNDVVALYQTALSVGADMIIGPLDKAAVARLNAQAELRVPTIALNYLDETVVGQPNLIQMGLSVTDEARQIAQRAWLEGARHALVVAPQTRWAEKAVKTFSDTWAEFNGHLEKLPPFTGSQQDFSASLSSALHVGQSNQRKQRLARVLGKRVDFTPRRRRDIDMVFMVAYPDQARQIKPTINFFYASDLRVYATSHVYTGSSDPGRNRDLNGIKFSAMPWALGGFLAAHLKPDESIYSAFRQLYALGLDAYQLHLWLQQLKTVPGATLSGATGVIELDGFGAVHRLHPWAVFKQGRVVPAPGMDEI